MTPATHLQQAEVPSQTGKVHILQTASPDALSHSVGDIYRPIFSAVALLVTFCEVGCTFQVEKAHTSAAVPPYYMIWIQDLQDS